MNDIYEERDWVDTTAAFAPAVLGAAAGILVSEAMSSRARRPIGLSLACIGLAALTPMLVETAMKKFVGRAQSAGHYEPSKGFVTTDYRLVKSNMLRTSLARNLEWVNPGSAQYSIRESLFQSRFGKGVLVAILVRS